MLYPPAQVRGRMLVLEALTLMRWENTMIQRRRGRRKSRSREACQPFLTRRQFGGTLIRRSVEMTIYIPGWIFVKPCRDSLGQDVAS